MTAFEEFGLMPELGQAVEEMEWLLPTAVQAEAIPMILGGGDVLMAAETGSGKTGIVCETIRDQKAGKRAKTDASSSVDALTPALDKFDRDSEFAIAADGLTCQSRNHHKWQGARGNVGAKKGQHYYEVTITDEGLCRMGWATVRATRELGIDKQGYGFGGTGKKSYGRQFDTYGEPFGLNDVMGCFLDLDRGTVHFSKNGKEFEQAYTIAEDLRGSEFFPACVLKNAELRFNFGGQPFAHPPKGGYKGLVQHPKENKCVKTQAASEKPRTREPLALILEPSKELAEQVQQQVKMFKKHLPAPGIRDALLIGGMSAKDQLKTLKDGAEIVVGTPGRVEDFVKSGKLDLSQIRFYILDEVDGLLSQGHKGLIERLYQQLPKQCGGRRLQMIVCSATLHSPDVKTFAKELMHFPTWIDLKGQDAVPDTVHHCVCWINPRVDHWWQTGSQQHKLLTDGVHKKGPSEKSKEGISQAMKVLKYKYLLAAINKYSMDQAIIFCRTKLDCDNVEKFLVGVGGGNKMVNEYSCCCVHSDRKVPERRANLESFKNGESRFLICTDVAARGIDVRGIPYVINFTLPDEKENYIHRIGRVGRADRMGLAISLCGSDQEKVWYHTCQSRGRGCHNTQLRKDGGCAIWYDEPNLLSEIQTHLGVDIPVIGEDMDIPVNEFDGKVVYGAKRGKADTSTLSHASELTQSVAHLYDLEQAAQSSFHSLKTKRW